MLLGPQFSRCLVPANCGRVCLSRAGATLAGHTHTVPQHPGCSSSSAQGAEVHRICSLGSSIPGKNREPHSTPTPVFLLLDHRYGGLQTARYPLRTNWGMRGPAGSGFFRETRATPKPSPHLLAAGWLHSRADASRRGGGSGSWSC